MNVTLPIRLHVEPVDTTCKDFDHECPDVRNKLACWLYDPQRGMCPYLRALPSQGKNS